MCLVSWSCPTLYDTMDWNLIGSSVHGIVQARILEWFACHSPWWYVDREIDRSIDFSGGYTTSWGSWCLQQAIFCLIFISLHGSISYVLVYVSVLDQELWWGPFLSEYWSLHWLARRATCSIKGCFKGTEMTHMLHLKGTETHPASYTPWPVAGTSKACPLGPGGRAVLSCESRVYFEKLSSPARSPTPRFTRHIAGASTQPRRGVKVTLNSSTLISHIQPRSKRIQLPECPWPQLSSSST